LYYSDKKSNLIKAKYQIPDLKVDICLFVEDNFEKDKSIFQETSKKDLLQKSEVSERIFINSNKISNILDIKCDYLENHSVQKSVEKSINLRKKDK
jgi:hypothetical protein